MMREESRAKMMDKRSGIDSKNLLDRVSSQSVGSSNTDVLDSPSLLVLITGTSQSRQHAVVVESVEKEQDRIANPAHLTLLLFSCLRNFYVDIVVRGMTSFVQTSFDMRIDGLKNVCEQTSLLVSSFMNPL
ncbi:hypothetical protein Tco_0397251 [Tanacetum coccineum]